MNEQNVVDEIRKFISDKMEAGDVVIVGWITEEILGRRRAIENEDAPFYMTCARKFIRDAVSRVIGKYDAQSRAADPQIVLPGFEYLQRAYTVKRNGEVTLVPINQLTNSELLVRASEYDEMAKGCRTHAIEIRDFVRARCEHGAA